MAVDRTSDIANIGAVPLVAEAEPEKPIAPGQIAPGVDVPLPSNEAPKPAAATSVGPAASARDIDAIVAKAAVSASTARGTANDVTRPFMAYDLPASEAQVRGQTPTDSAELHQTLTWSISELVGGVFARDTASWLSDRSNYLASHVEDSVFHQLAGTQFGQLFAAAAVEHLKPNDAYREAVKERYGEVALALTDAANEGVAQAILGNGVLGENVPTETILSGIVASFTARGFPIEGAPAAQKAERGGSFLTGPQGKVPPAMFGEVGARFGVMVLDASPAYFIQLAARLLQGDIGKDIDMLMQRLQVLKQENSKLIAHINEKMGSIVGLQASSAEAAAGARAAGECARTWEAIGSVVGCVVSIVTAVWASVVSFGTLTPGITALLSAPTSFPAMIATAACASAVCSVINTVPQALELAATVARGLGLHFMAEWLHEAAAAVTQWYGDNKWFTDAVMGIQIAASTFLTVYSLIASVAAFASAGAAINSMISAMVTLSQAAALAVQGTCQVMSAVSIRDQAKLTRAFEALRSELASLEVDLKSIGHRLEVNRWERDETQDELKTVQDREQRIMENVNKAADSFRTLLQAAALN